MQPKKELRNRARELELEGQPREALNHYQRLVDRSESPPPVLWYRIGDLQVGLGEIAAGIDSLSHAVNGFLAEGEVNNAIAMCCRVLDAEPASPGAQLKLGELALQQGYRRDAADAFAAYNRWVVESGDPSDAIYPLTAFLKRFPEEDELWRQWAEELFARVGEEKTIGMLMDLLASLGAEGGPAAAEIEAEIRVLRGESLPQPEAEAETEATEDIPDLPVIQGGDLGDPDLDFGTLEGLEPTSFEAAQPDEPEGLGTSSPSLDHAPEDEPHDDDHYAGDLDIELHQPWVGEEIDQGTPADEEPLPAFARDNWTGESESPSESDDDWESGPEELPTLSSDPVGAEKPAGFDPAVAAARLRGLVEADAERGDDPASHYDLGVAFKEMGLVDQAIAHLAHALEGGHDSVATAEVLGEILVGGGRYEEAAALLEPLRRTAADDGQMIAIDYLLARSHEGLGDEERARSGYRSVLSTDPGFQDAEQRLRSLGAEAL